MAEITIRFRYNKVTGHKEMVIHMESDADALPHEHERDHRAWAEQLIGRPIGDDIDEVVIERIAKNEGLGSSAETPTGAARTPQAKKS